VDVFTWDGGGATTNWGDGANWDKDCTPGEPEDMVTIPPGAHVFLLSGESAKINALNNFGTLTVASGAWLTTLNDSVSDTLNLQGGLASHATFRVTSLLNWTHTSAGGAPTQTTRRCPPLLQVAPFGYDAANDPWEEDCSSPAATPGRTIIAKGATMNIDGVGDAGRAGVNLSDGRVIQNNGTVILSNNGYIAADDGTRFLNVGNAASTGKFLIKNDFGYYQGFTKDDLAWPVDLSVFRNTGKVTKASGDGVSLMAADFSNIDPAAPSNAGQVQVLAGTLSIMTSAATTTRTAAVQGGSRFGNGGCSADSGCSVPIPDPTDADRKVVTVQVTKTTSLKPTRVNITEDAPGVNKPVDITTPNASADGAISFSRPLRFRIYLQLDPAESPAGVAKNAPVFRNGVSLPDCNETSQNPTQLNPTCVARQLSKLETADPDFKAQPGKDVVIVISSVKNSRYRVGA
jgi:hypothetical protein